MPHGIIRTMTRRRALTLAAVAGAPVVAAPTVRALAFDVFGTVVDWRGSIIRDGKQWSKQKPGLPAIDWGVFADRWRAGYGPAMDKVRKGQLPWTKIDDLHRLILDQLLVEFHITGLSEEEKQHWNQVWHRLDPWPDAVAGLTRLKKKYLIATLSNGNTSLLANMAKYAKLPWDVVLSAEMARHYKPDREAYLMAADYLGCQPGQLLMTAAHPGDLQAARKAGLKTAYVPRPLERGPKAKLEPAHQAEFDFVAKDFLDLATQLGV